MQLNAHVHSYTHSKKRMCIYDREKCEYNVQGDSQEIMRNCYLFIYVH